MTNTGLPDSDLRICILSVILPVLLKIQSSGITISSKVRQAAILPSEVDSYI